MRSTAQMVLVASAATLLSTAGLAVVASTPAGAIGPLTFTVDNWSQDSADSSVGDGNCADSLAPPDGQGHCTLRAAVQEADASTTGGIVLVPPNHTYTLTLNPPLNNAPGTDGATGDLLIAPLNEFGLGNVTIQPASAGPVTISTSWDGNVDRVIAVMRTGVANITGITVTGGHLSDAAECPNGMGAGILNEGTLNLTNSTVQGNSVASTSFSQGGAGIDTMQGNQVAAITNLTNDTITGNTTGTFGFGGGVEQDTCDELPLTKVPTTNIVNTTVSNNTAEAGAGVQEDAGSITITGSTVTGNQATNDGGGVRENGGSSSSGSLAITNSSVTSNTALGAGGGIEGAGGGAPVTITNSTISDNVANSAGGIYLDGPDIWNITGTTVNNNHAQSTVVLPKVARAPAAQTSPHTKVPHSTSNGAGGGIFNGACDQATFINDTIDNNSADTIGGGYVSDNCNGENNRQQTFMFVTIASNTAGLGLAGANIDQSFDSSHLQMSDSIVAYGSPNANCTIEGPNGATVVSLGYNLFDDSTCGAAATGDIIGKDPLLGPLGANGGPTKTMLPLDGSPAIGAILSAACSQTEVNNDQRGVTRPQGANGSCTMGAVEVGPHVINFNGYRMGADEGGVFDFGINFGGSLANNHLNAPIVGIANSPGPNGYLLVGGDGGVFALGGALYYGSLGGQQLSSAIAAIAANPGGTGYWLASQSGTIYKFGAVPTLPAVQLPAGAHVTGIASTNSGLGLWVTDNRGDVYALGDALFFGSLGGQHINAPIVGIAPAATGQGYILAAADGGAFCFGAAGFFGSVPGVLKTGQVLNAPVVGVAETHSGQGYWMVGTDGGVFAFGDAPFLGSIYTQLMAGQKLNGPIIGIQHLGNSVPS